MTIGVALIAPVRAHREALATALAGTPGILIASQAASSAEAIGRLNGRHAEVVLVDFGTDDVITTIARMRNGTPSTQLVAFGIGPSPEQSEAVIRAAERGVSGFVERDQPLADILDAIHLVARGVPVCSPRIVSLLLQGLQRGATGQAVPAIHGARLVAPLTPRERLVAELAADGLTNRQIAAELSLGESTVKTHMHAILHKLGLSSRNELLVVPRSRPSAE